jgi:hypothetical protein
MLAFLHNTADTIHTSLFAGMTDWARFGVRLMAAVIFGLIMLGILWIELRRPPQKSIEVAKQGGTMIRISTDAVEAKLRDAVDNLSGVIGSKVSAQTRGKAIAVNLDVLATRETDLVAKAEEIAALTQSTIQEQLGLKLHSRPQIVIKAGPGKAKVDRKPLFPGFTPKAEPAKSRPAEVPAVIAAPEAVVTAPHEPEATVGDAKISDAELEAAMLEHRKRVSDA